jgi:hypothetical protein
MIVGSGLLVSRPRQQGHAAYHIYKDMWQTMSIRTCGRPRLQGHVANHVSKYTSHNQMMTSFKRKFSRAMSTSDIRNLHHSGRINSEFSPPRNVKSIEVPKDEVLKSLSIVDLRYPSDVILIVR